LSITAVAHHLIRFTEIADAAEREQLTYRGFLAELLLAECDDRDRRRTVGRVRAAGFPAKSGWVISITTPTRPSTRPPSGRASGTLLVTT
jgi:hypothetical protein